MKLQTCILLWKICMVFPHFLRRNCQWTEKHYVDWCFYRDGSELRVTFFWCSTLLLASSTRLKVSSSLPTHNQNQNLLSRPNSGRPTHPLTTPTIISQGRDHFCVSPFSNLCLGRNLEAPCSPLGLETSSGKLPAQCNFLFLNSRASIQFHLDTCRVAQSAACPH